MTHKETAKKAIERYPDLKKLSNTRLIVYAYRFREEQLMAEKSSQSHDLANGRSDVWLENNIKLDDLPKDLPYINIFRVCVLCDGTKRTLNICPDCWRTVRK